MASTKQSSFLPFGFNRDSWQTLGQARRQAAAIHYLVKKTMIKELDQIVLAADLPEEGLQKGDVGTVVLVHENGKGYEVEFMTLDGETVAVVTCLPNRYVRSLLGKLQTPAPSRQSNKQHDFLTNGLQLWGLPKLLVLSAE